MTDDELVERGRHVVESLLGAAVIVGFVLAVIVLMAWGFGYPGFNEHWLTNVVAPTYVSLTVLVAGFWLWLDGSRRRRISNDE